MTISKAHWDTEGDNVRLSMPFSKVDQERRIVSGFATLDNIDKQMDIVTPEASLAAFSKFRGNIREMHQPSAVGKMVSFKEDKYFDPETKKFYSGIYVSAYVSKGAQDCWEKVLDGTYTGFSIGGRMNKWDDGYDEKMDTQIRIIKDYDLVELSLVDNPANQFASILSVEKVDGVDTLKGDAVDTVIENVFWDKESGIVTLSEEDSAVSPTSGLPMQNIGFVEKSDSEKVDMIKFLVDSAKGINVTKMTQEENNMANSNEIVNDVTAENAENEIVEIAPEADAEATTVDTEEVAETPEEDAAETEAEEAEEVAEVTGEVPADVSVENEAVSKSDEATVNAVADLKNTITSAFSDIIDVVKAQSAEITELKKSLGLVESKLEDAEGGFNNLGKRIDAVEADTAFRKSGDLGEIVQEPAMVEKSVWGGSFLTTSDLLK
jgi:flagellin-like hook-associated protein FlgL